MTRVSVRNLGPGPIQVRWDNGNSIADQGEGTTGEYTAPLIVLTPDEVAMIQAGPPPLPHTAETKVEGDASIGDPTDSKTPVDIAFALAKTENVDIAPGSDKAAEQMPPLTAKGAKALKATAAGAAA